MKVSTLFAGLIFGAIGFVAFAYGKKQTLFKPMILGIVLMVYPYFISNAIALWVIGILLTVALYFFRD